MTDTIHEAVCKIPALRANKGQSLAYLTNLVSFSLITISALSIYIITSAMVAIMVATRIIYSPTQTTFITFSNPLFARVELFEYNKDSPPL